MAYNKINNLLDAVVDVFNPTAGSTSGSTIYIQPPVRGYLKEVGFSPRATLTTDTTLRATISRWTSSTASVITEVISSTLGTFDSNQLVAGNIMSVLPASPVFFNPNDTLAITTSGGNSSLTGATVYAVFSRG